jgi:hypothetical protein
MPFGDSDPRIYQAMKSGGTIQKWANEDYYAMLAPLVGGPMNLAWNTETHKLQQSGPRGLVNNTPWCHMRHAPRKRCGLDHHILFNTWGIIPPKCMECWKVVVSPRTFHELMLLEEVEHGLQQPSKCGIELRDYTPRFYGGYFYNHSLDEGREKYEMVRKAVDEHISKDVDIILKRACTEFEMIKGPSHQWQITAAEEAMIELVEHYVDLIEVDHDQSDLFKNHVRLKWVLWAHNNGDMSYLDWNGGEELFPKCLTYHDHPLEDLKHDLALGRAQSKCGVDPVKTSEFYNASIKWAEKNEIDPQALTTMLGMNNSNPLNLRASVPDVLQGEHDELT